MNMNQGKISFSNPNDADNAAKRMSRKYSEAFTTYRGKNGLWYVGGVFAKHKSKIKFNSFTDLKNAWAQYLDHENDDAVDNYIMDVSNKLDQNAEDSVDRGTDAVWTLVGLEEKIGLDLGFRNTSIYLVLEITNGITTINPKMGGAFGRHIPLMRKVAQDLIDKPVVWATWNKKGSTQWTRDEWFYKLDLNTELHTDFHGND